jgi:hypothetical protein
MRNIVVLYRALCLACGLVQLCLWGCDFPPTAGVNSGIQDFQTTQVRYVNLTNSPVGHVLQARFTLYSPATRTTSATTIPTDTVKSLQISQFFAPLADSSRITVLEVGASMAFYPLLRPLTFTSRNATYTLVGLPPRSGKGGVLDTLLVLTALPPETSANTVNIRFINCIGDTTKNYSFTLGCPSGTPVGSNIAYRASSGVFPIALNGENLSVAVTEQTLPASSTATAPAPIQKGLFNLSPIVAGSSYTVLLYKDAKDSIGLLALNDFSSNRLTVSPALSPTTSLRVANFSDGAIDSLRYGSSKIASGIGRNIVSKFEKLTACASASSDIILIQRQNGLLQQSLSTSLDVNGSQTVFLSDSLAVAAPASVVQPPSGSISLRVVNLTSVPTDTTFFSISVLRGATKQSRAQSIVSNLRSGRISASITLSREDFLPLIVFNAQQPQSVAQFGISATMGMSTASAFFLVVTKKNLFLIPDIAESSGSQSSSAPPLPQGALIQALHVFSDATTGTVQMGLGSVFRDAVAFGAPQLTVLPADTQNITLGNTSESPTLENGMHMLVVGMGTVGAGQVLVEKGLWSWPSDSLPRQGSQGWLRYLNASSDVSNLRVQADTQLEFFENMPLNRKQLSSPIRRFYRDQTRTLTFLNNNGETLFTARNVPFSLGNGYTIIFAGQSSNGYNAIVLPEY